MIFLFQLSPKVDMNQYMSRFCRNTSQPSDLQNISDCSGSPDAFDYALLHKVSQITLQQQELDNLRRKDFLRGAETAEISVRLGNYSASHFEGSAYCR
jgi:hypothetical protein